MASDIELFGRGFRTRSRISPPPLHVVTDDAVLARPDFRRCAERALTAGGGRLALHLRGPGTGGARLYRLARELEPAARRSGALLAVNDRVDVGLVRELGCVHLGERGFPVAEARALLGAGVLIGRSVHDLDGARAADAGGADYLFVGTIFSSASHPDRSGSGPGRIREVLRAVDGPVYGIGGIEPARVAPVLNAGARGIVVLSGVWSARDPVEAVRTYLAALDR